MAALHGLKLLSPDDKELQGLAQQVLSQADAQQLSLSLPGLRLDSLMPVVPEEAYWQRHWLMTLLREVKVELPSAALLLLPQEV
jgi:hypothetical protein